MTEVKTRHSQTQKVNTAHKIISVFLTFRPARGVDVNAHRKDHWTPLHLASHWAKPEIVRLLLDHGATANAEDNFLRTPLHHVAGGSYVSQEDGAHVAQILLKHGVDVNVPDTNRDTPLHLASLTGRPEIVKLLLEHTAVKYDHGQAPSNQDLEGEFYPKVTSYC